MIAPITARYLQSAIGQPGGAELALEKGREFAAEMHQALEELRSWTGCWCLPSIDPVSKRPRHEPKCQQATKVAGLIRPLLEMLDDATCPPEAKAALKRWEAAHQVKRSQHQAPAAGIAPMPADRNDPNENDPNEVQRAMGQSGYRGVNERATRIPTADAAGPGQCEECGLQSSRLIRDVKRSQLLCSFCVEARYPYACGHTYYCDCPAPPPEPCVCVQCGRPTRPIPGGFFTRFLCEGCIALRGGGKGPERAAAGLPAEPESEPQTTAPPVKSLGKGFQRAAAGPSSGPQKTQGTENKEEEKHCKTFIRGFDSPPRLHPTENTQPLSQPPGPLAAKTSHPGPLNGPGVGPGPDVPPILLPSSNARCCRCSNAAALLTVSYAPYCVHCAVSYFPLWCGALDCDPSTCQCRRHLINAPRPQTHHIIRKPYTSAGFPAGLTCEHCGTKTNILHNDTKRSKLLCADCARALNPYWCGHPYCSPADCRCAVNWQPPPVSNKELFFDWGNCQHCNEPLSNAAVCTHCGIAQSQQIRDAAKQQHAAKTPGLPAAVPLWLTSEALKILTAVPSRQVAPQNALRLECWYLASRLIPAAWILQANTRRSRFAKWVFDRHHAAAKRVIAQGKAK